MYQKETILIIVPIWATLGLLAFFFDGEADLAIRVGRGGGSNFCFCAASWRRATPRAPHGLLHARRGRMRERALGSKISTS